MPSAVPCQYIKVVLSVADSEYTDNCYSSILQLINCNKFTQHSKLAAARREICGGGGGGAPINFWRRRRRQLFGGGDL